MGLVLFVLVSMALLARFLPRAAFAIGLALAALSTVTWHLWSVNLSLPLAVVLGLFTGLVARDVKADRGTSAPSPTVATIIWLAATLPAVAILAARRLPTPSLWSLELMEPTRFFEFSSHGLAANVFATAVWCLPPVIFFRALPLLGGERTLALFVPGACLAVAGPPAQYLLGIPLAQRPDQPLARNEGLVGFFQDPHSFAAFLVFSTCVLVAAVSEARREGRHKLAAVYAAFTMLAAVELLATHSLGGIVSLCVCATIGACFALRNPTDPWRILAPVAVLAAGFLLVLTIAAGAVPGQGLIYRTATQIGIEEGAVRLFRQDVSPESLVRMRWLLLLRSKRLALKYPLWGIGPGMTTQTPIYDPELARRMDLVPGPLSPTPENTHNVYVQMASEVGFLPVIVWLGLVGGSLGLAARAVVQCPNPPRSPAAVGLIAAACGILVFSLWSNALLLPELSLPLWLALSAAVATAPGVTPPATRER